MKRLSLVIMALLLLSACAAKKSAIVEQADVGLTAEQRSYYQGQISALERQIQDYQPVKEGDSLYAPIFLFIDLARAYDAMGNYKAAIETYKRALALHKSSQAVTHNMGRVYEKMHDCDKAVEQYKILVNDYKAPGYWYDITWDYIRAGRRIEAEKAFNEWQNALHKTDEQTQQVLKKMREREK